MCPIPPWLADLFKPGDGPPRISDRNSHLRWVFFLIHAVGALGNLPTTWWEDDPGTACAPPATQFSFAWLMCPSEISAVAKGGQRAYPCKLAPKWLANIRSRSSSSSSRYPIKLYYFKACSSSCALSPHSFSSLWRSKLSCCIPPSLFFLPLLLLLYNLNHISYQVMI